MSHEVEAETDYLDTLYADFDRSLCYVEEMHSLQPELAEAEMGRALDFFGLFCEYYEADDDFQTEDNETRIYEAKERVYYAMVKLRKL